MPALAATQTSERLPLGRRFIVRKRVSIVNAAATDEWVDFSREMQSVDSAWAQTNGNVAGVTLSTRENRLGTNGAASNGMVGIRAGGAATVDVYAIGR